MNQNYINFKIIFPNGDEMDCKGCEGDTLLTAINETLKSIPNSVVQPLDSKFLQTCIVKIENAKLVDHTSQELADFANINDNQYHRYAHTYKMSSELDGALIFLNVVRVHYRNQQGHDFVLYAYINENMVSLKERSDVIDRAFSCGGSFSCSSCHVFVKEEFFDYFDMVNHISPREEDLLDCAHGVSRLSRLGCAIDFTAEHDQIRLLHPRSENALSVASK